MLEWRHLARAAIEGQSQGGRWLECRGAPDPLQLASQRVPALAEQGPHLLRRHQVPGVQAVDPGQAGTHPHPRRFAPFGVVRRQADMPLVSGVQGGHLPGQVVIP